MTNNKWNLVARPEGLPKASDFEWQTEELKPLEDGEIRVRNVYLSLDPANRVWMVRDSYMPMVPLGETMRGGGIGIVEESRNSKFAVGDTVQGLLCWQTYYTGPGKGFSKVPSLGIPLSAHYGLFGHIGYTAYFGLLDIGAPKEGETLVVSAAAGAVGSLAGQIGRIKGCRVVGIAGTDDKCQWITRDLGFDAAINYKTEDLRAALKRHCPNGVDIYFENVGGATLEAVLNRMNNFGRIPACGMVSTYNRSEPEPGPNNLFHIITKRLKMQGFIVIDYAARFEEARAELLRWHQEGRLHYRLDINHGLECAPAAFLKLFDGSNTGKLLVQVSPES